MAAGASVVHRHGRAAAAAALDERCPRCDAVRLPGQEYCVDCGLRLPPLAGPVAALRRGWVRRLGWYPGDWVWRAGIGLVVAAAGAALAIELGGGPRGGSTTEVAPFPPTVAAAPAASALPEVPVGRPSTGAAARLFRWPPGRSGWTIVLSSYPRAGGTGTPIAAASHAQRAGLPEVGMLDSARFSSLHAGYYVVFSGLYSTAAEAAAALRSVHAAGFARAYTRQITR